MMSHRSSISTHASTVGTVGPRRWDLTLKFVACGQGYQVDVSSVRKIQVATMLLAKQRTGKWYFTHFNGLDSVLILAKMVNFYEVLTAKFGI